MLKEYNDYALTNPNGRSKGIPQYLPSRFANEKRGAVGQYPTRYVRQQIHVAQGYEWRPKDEDMEDDEGEPTERDPATEGRAEFGGFGEESFPDGADAFTGSESGIVSAQLAAASVGAIALAAVVYVFSLFVSAAPCSATTDALAFTLSIRNPDNVPLLAALTSDAGTMTRDVTDASYLLFDGLERGAEYALSIVNAETGETLYRKSYMTATEDSYFVSVENAELSPDGVFSFDLSVLGLQRGDFYALAVMGADGNALFSVDGTDEEASFSVPIGAVAEGGAMPFVTVTVNGKTFMPRVWADTAPDGGAEPVADAPQEAEAPEAVDAPENPQEPTGTPDDAQETEPATETPPEEAQAPEVPAETPPEAGTPQPPAETPREAAQTPVTPAETPQEAAQAPVTPAETPPQTPEPTPQTPQEAAQAPATPAQGPQGQAPTPDAPEEAGTPDAPDAPEEAQAPEEVPDAAREPAEWEWNEEHNAVVMEIPDPDTPGEFIKVEAPVTESVQEPTCTEDGVRTYTATVTGPDGETYTETRAEAIPAKGHSYERVSLHTEDGASFADYICPDCGENYRMFAAATEEPPDGEAEP